MEKLMKYNILEKIGSGGMGEVYKGFDTVLERYVAIKLLHNSLSKNKQNIERLLVEARAAARLIHPNVVTIYDVGQNEYGHYIIMEYVEGASLSEMIYRDGPLNLELSKKIIIQILKALGLAHKKGIYHRDIKAENILITEEKDAKVLDFGIAKIGQNSKADSEQEVLGTIEYMAPEQMLGEAVDHRSDIYSAGILLYQMLTKRMPYNGKNSVDILFKKLNEEPVVPSYYNKYIPKYVDDAIITALNYDREKRWQSGEDMIEALKTRLNAKTATADDFWSASHTPFFEKEDEEADYTNAQFRPVFIGRDEEFKKLITAYNKTINELGQTVILAGEAGIGKSTLATQFRNYLEHQETWVLQSACLYQEGMDAYLPYIEALRAFLSHDNSRLSEAQRNELKKMIRQNVPILTKFTERFKTTFISQTSGTGEDEANQNTNLFEDIFQLLSMLSELRPTIVIIDDLQWADESSLKLFHYLARKIENKRILLFGILRSDHYDLQENGKPKKIVDILARMRREYLFEEIKVKRFNRRDSDLLIDKLLENSAFSEEFYEGIYRETKGNPFFLIETLKNLKEKGHIFINGDIWVDKKIDFKLEVPDRVEDIFVRRLSAISQEDREILQVASVFGYKFDPALLAYMMEWKKINLLKRLQKIENDHQVITNSESQYQFEHPMLGDLLYSEIPSALLREYHLMLAEKLEEMHRPHYGAYIGDVAKHYYRGGDYTHAMPLLYRAGERAFELSAYRAAAIFYEDLLDSVSNDHRQLPQSIPPEYLYFKLGICYEELGELEQSISVYRKYAEVSLQQNNQQRRIDAYMRIGRVQDKLGEFEKSLELYRQCLNLTQKYKVQNVLSRVYNKMGIHFFHQGNYDEALKYFNLTIKSIDSEYGEFDKAHAYTNIGIIANIIRGDYGIALENFKKALQIYERKNDGQGQATVYHNIGMFYSDKGQWLESIKALERCLQLADETESKRLHALTYLNMGKAFARQEKTAKAKRLTEKALKMFKRMSDVISIGEAYHIFGIIFSKEGNFFKAEDYLKEAINIFRKKNYLEGLAESQFTYGNILVEQGEMEVARNYFNDALELFKSINISSKVKELSQKISTIEPGDHHTTDIDIIKQGTSSIKRGTTSIADGYKKITT